MSGPLTKVRIDRRTDRPTLSFWRQIEPAYYKGFEGNEANVSAGIDEFFDMQLIDFGVYLQEGFSPVSGNQPW